MENTTEPISEEEATKQQQRVAELRRYIRDYYRALTTSSKGKFLKFPRYNAKNQV